MIEQNDTECWTEVRLGDHIDILTGFPFKSGQYVDDNSGIRLLRGDNVAQGLLRWENVKRWPVQNTGDFSKYWLQEGDVILAMDRPWIEAGLKWGWVRATDLPSLLVQRVARMRGTPTMDTDFLRYVIGHPAFTAYVRAVHTGTSVPHISANQISDYRFCLPPISTQRKIAGILSAYDDLIENNTRRIAILEEMARRIYEEWFVHFRYPGHENIPLVDSELGPIPEGWAVGAFSEIAEVRSGGTPKTSKSEFWNGPIPFFTPKDAPKGFLVFSTEKTITELGLSHCNSELYDRDTVFITARGTVGKLAVPYVPMAMNQSCYALKPKPGWDARFIRMTAAECVARLRQEAHGAVFDTIIVATFDRLNIAVPSKDIAGCFVSYVAPLFDELSVLGRAHGVLTDTRNLVLQKLMSGTPIR